MGHALFLLRFVTDDTFVHFWGGIRPEGSEGGVSGLPMRFACRTGRFRWGRKAKAGVEPASLPRVVADGWCGRCDGRRFAGLWWSLCAGMRVCWLRCDSFGGWRWGASGGAVVAGVATCDIPASGCEGPTRWG